jgi:N-glycosidase YbiA
VGDINRGTMAETIKFYMREDPYGFLSNFWRHVQFNVSMYHRATAFATNEHWYQSQKARDEKTRNWIASAPTATLAMKAGRMLSPAEVREDWNEVKIAVMREGLLSKFSDPNLRLMLKWTGDALLIEDSPVDKFWGGSLPGSKNMLGILLMEVRDGTK